MDRPRGPRQVREVASHDKSVNGPPGRSGKHRCGRAHRGQPGIAARPPADHAGVVLDRDPVPSHGPGAARDVRLAPRPHRTLFEAGRRQRQARAGRLPGRLPRDDARRGRLVVRGIHRSGNPGAGPRAPHNRSERLDHHRRRHHERDLRGRLGDLRAGERSGGRLSSAHGGPDDRRRCRGCADTDRPVPAPVGLRRGMDGLVARPLGCPVPPNPPNGRWGTR